MPTIDLGSVVGPQGPQGNTGPQGEQGVAGPSLISTSTQTTLTGVLAGDGNVVGVRTVDASPTNLSTNLVTSGGVYDMIKTDDAYLKSTTVNPNLLDNAYFIGGGSQQGGGQFPINQRGQTTYTGSGRKIDRWGFGAAGGEMNLTDAGVSVKVISGAQSFSQNVDVDPKTLLGKTVTASALVILSSVHTLYKITTALPSTLPTSTTTYESVSIPGLGNFTIGWANGVGRFSVGFSNSSSSSGFVTIEAVKLELGSTQTLCHNEGTGANPTWVLNEIPNYTTELLKCYRYLYIYTGLTTACATSTANVYAMTIPYPIPLRAAPTEISGITYYDEKESTGYAGYATGLRLYNSSSLAFSVTSFLVSAEL